MSRTEELRAAIGEARAATLAVLGSLSPDDWATEVQSEGEHWTVRHVVSHLFDTENAQAMLWSRMLDGQETVPEDFDIDRWNARVRKMPEMGPDELMSALDASHQGVQAVLDRITDEDLDRTGRHPGNLEIMTLDRFLELLAWHEGHHLGEITTGLGLE